MYFGDPENILPETFFFGGNNEIFNRFWDSCNQSERLLVGIAISTILHLMEVEFSSVSA